jgi:arylsulfatase
MSAGALLPAQNSKPVPPNLLVILADDLGYSDIAPYGGEIETPHLARLAGEGVRFRQFYNCARCCPTRSSLLTGLYNHQAGVGHMIQNLGAPSYQGYLNDRCSTLAEALKPAGYRALMSGKWHVGEEQGHWPLDRGFDRYFGLISGASSYFELSKGRRMALDRAPWTPEPGKPFYMTDAIAAHAERMVREEQGKPSPLALYLAFTAPHWPLHALPEDIAKYRGRYRRGWDTLREERRERQRAMGLSLPSWRLSPRDGEVPAWKDLDEKARDAWDLRMAVYAAQVDRMDRGIGRVLDALRETGRLDNTLVLFVSDNGGCAEENIGGEAAAANPVPGGADSFTSYRRPWANASNTPFRYWKQITHEGGIATPGILWRAGLGPRAGGFVDDQAHVIDILPTLLDAAGAPPPRTQKLEGRSLLPVLAGRRAAERPVTGWEHQGHRALRMGRWKAVSRYQQPWELYDLEDDRSELNDLGGKDPARHAAMQREWQSWADRCGVLPWAEIRGGNRKQ